MRSPPWSQLTRSALSSVKRSTRRTSRDFRGSRVRRRRNENFPSARGPVSTLHDAHSYYPGSRRSTTITPPVDGVAADCSMRDFVAMFQVLGWRRSLDSARLPQRRPTSIAAVARLQSRTRRLAEPALRVAVTSRPTGPIHPSSPSRRLSLTKFGDGQRHRPTLLAAEDARTTFDAVVYGTAGTGAPHRGAAAGIAVSFRPCLSLSRSSVVGVRRRQREPSPESESDLSVGVSRLLLRIRIVTASPSSGVTPPETRRRITIWACAPNKHSRGFD